MENKKWYENAVMINRDPNWAETYGKTTAEEITKEYERVFSSYSGAITDVLIGLLEQTAMVPNNSFMWRGEKYFWEKENGYDVDYKNHAGIVAHHKLFNEYHIDPVQIFIKEMNKKGIRPWITLRMNDCHQSKNETSFLRSDMYYEEDKAGHTLGDEYGYSRNCYNFRYERYPNAILSYIEELLDRYDVFGFELDFMRSMSCFDYKNDSGYQPIMTEFIRKVRAITNAAGKKRGHDIKLSLRTCHSISDAFTFGFDIKTIAKEGLIDVLVPSPSWSPTDSGLPIKEWRELIGDDIALIAGIETNNVWAPSATVNEAKNSKAYAAAFYSQGADGIYFNNHEYLRPRNIEAWEINKNNCLEGHREFVVTHQDLFIDEKTRYKPLPRTFIGKTELTVCVGPIKATDKVKLVIDFIGEERPILTTGEFNLKPVRVEPLYSALSFYDKEMPVTPNIPIEYDISGISTDSELTFTFEGVGTIGYVNVIIDA